MNSEAFVALAVKTTGLKQKDLAAKLGVSPTQITKWKKGEFMSFEMESRFRSLTGIGDLDPEVVLSTGSIESATKWQELIRFIANEAEESSETGYDTEPLSENISLLTWQVFSCLTSIGAVIPKTFPSELDFDYKAHLADPFLSDEEVDSILHENLYSSAIYSAFLVLNDLYGFYSAYILELEFNNDLNFINSEAANIGPCLLNLAFAKLDLDGTFAPNLPTYRFDTLSDYKRWINVVKSIAWEAGIPVRAELMKLVTCESDEVGAQAEQESLGLNSERIHSDVYMNELLEGMRAIHQVLPAILQKLGIDDFKMDVSKLRAR